MREAERAGDVTGLPRRALQAPQQKTQPSQRQRRWTSTGENLILLMEEE